MARNFVVTVKESSAGKPWLLVELHEDIGLSAGQHIVMHLSEGADITEAERVARFLNENVARFRVERV